MYEKEKQKLRPRYKYNVTVKTGARNNITTLRKNMAILFL